MLVAVLSILKIFKVSNLNTALKFLKTKEFWVSAFDISDQQKILQKITGKEKMCCYLVLKDMELKAKTLRKCRF